MLPIIIYVKIAAYHCKKATLEKKYFEAELKDDQILQSIVTFST